MASKSARQSKAKAGPKIKSLYFQKVIKYVIQRALTFVKKIDEKKGF